MPKLGFVLHEICPKCGKPAWNPYAMSVTKKYGKSTDTRFTGMRARNVPPIDMNPVATES